MAYRVPTTSVSVTDLSLSLEKDIDVEELNNSLKTVRNLFKEYYAILYGSTCFARL